MSLQSTLLTLSIRSITPTNGLLQKTNKKLSSISREHSLCCAAQREHFQSLLNVKQALTLKTVNYSLTQSPQMLQLL